MKTAYILLISILCLASITAQEKTQTLFSDENSYGGFGAPLVVVSNINGTTVADVGGGAAFSVNSFFFGGYGLGNNGAQHDLGDEVYDIHFKHGGFWLGYAYKNASLVHLYSSFRIGWGKTELKQNEEKLFSDNLLALAPELGLELNVTNWLKVGFTGGFRLISGINDLPELTNDDLSGYYGAITFRIGGFGDYHSYNDDKNKIDN